MTSSPTPPEARRPLASRSLKTFQHLAAVLASWRVAPNAISIASILLAIGAGAALAATSWTDGWTARASWLVAAVLVQLRLLANMIDGMVAVEHGRGSTVGDLYNEVPDRVSDAVILVGLGYAAGGWVEMGYVAAIVAVFVAYVRAIGASVGAGQVFAGPMAKPHRMFTVTVVSLYAGLAPSAWQPAIAGDDRSIAAVALVLIVAGGLLTVARRLARIASVLRKRES